MRKLHPLVVAIVMASNTVLHAQPSPPPASPPPTVTVQGRAELRVPDTEASIQLGCEAAGSEEAAVRKDVAGRSQAVVALLKKENVGRLQTTSLNIRPQFGPLHPEPGRPMQTPEIIGYTGQVMVSFRVPVEDAGRIIAAALDAGANSVSGVQTHPTDEARRDAEDKALSAAAKDAETQARTLISALGLSWVGIRSIDATGSTPGPFPMARTAMMMEGAAAPGLDIQAGETVVTREATMQVEFRMR